MDLIIFIVVTLVAIFSSLYLYAASQVSNLKKNWPQYRCNPLYMPMAGMIGDDVMSNFTQCTMKGFHDYAGFIMDPVVAEFDVVNETLGQVGTTLTDMRKMMSGVRGGFLGVVGSVFGKIQNVMSQTQYTVIRMRTLMSRVVAVMYSFMYVFYGGIQSGKSLVNGPVGSAMSLLCFDENTNIQTFEGFKPMKDVKLGERLLQNFSIVTSVYKVSGKGVQMYNLADIIVSGSHKVRFKGRYIRVDQHPQAKKLSTPSTTLICFNTHNHRIGIKNFEFLDFTETEDTEFNNFKNTYVQMLYNGKVHYPATNYKGGLLCGTKVPTDKGLKSIEKIEVGDVLDNGEIVRGVCAHKMKDTFYVEVQPGVLTGLGTWIYKDNQIVRADSCGKIQFSGIDSSVIYQLITDSSTYPVYGTNERLMILDELETTDPYYHTLKDSIITTGRFRSKVIVV